MNVYCYYEDAGEDVSRLIPLWSESWRRHGWNPIVLGREQAKQSTFYDRMAETVEQFPTVNQRAYSNANFIRYCALEAIGGGLFTDYDNINYGLKPDHLWHICKYNDLIRLFRGGFFYMTKNGCAKFINTILTPGTQYRACFILGQQPHVCDVCYLDYLNVPIINGLSVLYREYGWETAPTVHYSNDSVAGFGDKATYIQKVRPI